MNQPLEFRIPTMRYETVLDSAIKRELNNLMREHGVKESQISRLSSDFIYPMFTHELLTGKGL